MGRLGGQAFGGEKVVTPEALYSKVMHLARPAWGRARCHAGGLALERPSHDGVFKWRFGLLQQGRHLRGVLLHRVRPANCIYR